MIECDEFDEMVEACIEAGTLVLDHGSEELQQIMRVLLYRLGQEVARREEQAFTGFPKLHDGA
ncbi:hypothetical protein [Methylobacterium dankookense]|uniref:Uncharacterized protein n=1 Tax=Methylobacterium dankookense TaxID=560405 RepID=A0A564G140_9HYPH|nr:hypothetical protein [Methylobacterium dankookense]GJD58835.1 hypothetical protein IFDJLNFL_4761 [Methylobacterium dankookense]VUF14193.1 hypothetical protein MTDSW087_03909 [Methylobacterium dankookense]